MISTTAVTVTVGKKTAIAGGKGQFSFLLMHPDQPLLLMIVWYFKGAFKCACSGMVSPSVTDALIIQYYMGKLRPFGFRALVCD